MSGGRTIQDDSLYNPDNISDSGIHAPKDERVTMKLDRALWERVQGLIQEHPEWGILSVPEFIRRAIDSELRHRLEAESTRVINLQITPASPGKGGKTS